MVRKSGAINEKLRIEKNFKRSMAILFFAFLLVIPIFIGQTKAIVANSKKLEDLRGKSTALEDELASLRWEDENKDKPAFYEKIARTKLKMVKPSDLIYHDKAQDIKKTENED